MIPVSVIVVTRNAAGSIERCLAALHAFGEIIVVDSYSSDGTAACAEKAGARVVSFSWNGRYPKKRQWCLDTFDLRYDWVFFVDADEILPPALTAEITGLFAAGPQADGYIVTGRYVLDGQTLRHGLNNAKLCLFDRRAFAFPMVDDLDCPGMGEIEGHYQPVRRPGYAAARIGRLREPLLHAAYGTDWEARHRRYAAWESAMNRKNAWPADPVPARQILKRIFRTLPCRGLAAFAHSYVWKAGFLDGRAGWVLACSRRRYYRMIAQAQSEDGSGYPDSGML